MRRVLCGAIAGEALDFLVLLFSPLHRILLFGVDGVLGFTVAAPGTDQEPLGESHFEDERTRPMVGGVAVVEPGLPETVEFLLAFAGQDVEATFTHCRHWAFVRECGRAGGGVAGSFGVK
jgi:hypothetical protein